MSNDPTWLTDREEIALAALQGGWDEDAVHIAANSPAQVLALCKLVREIHVALEKLSPGPRGLEIVSAQALEAYQLGPVTGEESGG